MPRSATEAEADTGAKAETGAKTETGAKAERGVEGAMDGLDNGDNGPHAEAWPPGRTAAPSPMSSPVARIAARIGAAPSHGVTWDPLT